MTEPNSQNIKPPKTSSRWGTIARILIVLATSAVLVLSFPWEKTTEYAHLTVGSVVPKEIIAPFDFEVLKNPTDLEQERLAARRSVNPVFVRSDSIASSAKLRFDRLWDAIRNISVTYKQQPGSPQTLATALRDSIKDKPAFAFDLPAWQFLGQTAKDPSKSRAFITPLQKIISDIYTKGILNISPQEVQPPSGKISLMEQGEESLVSIDSFFTLSTARTQVVERLRSMYAADTSQAFDSLKVAYRLVVPFLTPNVIYDRAETEARRNRAVADVPTVKGLVLKNERIVDSNVRLTQDQLDKLRSLDIKRAELVRVRGGLQLIAPIAGRAALVLGLLVLMGGILKFMGHVLYRDFRQLLVFSIILILPVVSASLLIHQTNLPIVYLPVASTVIVVTFLFNMTVAVGFTLVAGTLIAAVAGYDFSVFILMLFPSLVAILAVQRAQTRGKIMMAAIYIGIAYLVTIALLSLLKYSFGTQTVHEMTIGVANAVVSPILAMGLLILFEQLSGVTTDLTLLELGDLNRPLLRRLALEAPGTYHHSIVVGNLAEAAAEAIGANSLLVRVAAYYHDIGKMENKEYFIENQEKGSNVHDLLSPEMSASVLRDHIARGLALAKKYHIPKVVSDFIPQHHGKSLMVYFYHKALKQSGAKEIDENLYRYPGPEPQTKEAGILMLADVVEATSKSLKNPDVEEVKSAIGKAIDSKVKEGDLDSSDLTLNDIKKIKEAFVHVISGTVRQRIEYPSSDDLVKAKSQENEPANNP
jgi:putative nucleotidyltransferase with HDIG domain